MLNIRVSAVRRRAALMGTAAFTAIAVSAPAQAQDVSIAGPALGDGATIRIADDVSIRDPRPILEGFETPHAEETADDASVIAGVDRTRVKEALETRFATAQVRPTDVVDTPSIGINNNITAADRFDPTNITGIGQILTDAGGGGVGTCTGSLVNRRTVIFAAHCVNSRPATAYGANSGGTGAAVAFETNTRANGPGQTDELIRWLFGTGPNATGRFETNTAQALFNMNQVFYHPGSLAPTSCTAPGSCFLEADIALGVLDTPTRNIPLWTMLFSPLTTPASIGTATGTGYHVTISGYGSTGNGTTGTSTTGGFRRRIAENMLGGLTSLARRSTVLFGSPGGNAARTQLLYFLDFDDPNRGKPGADPEDFNGFRDNALTREGITGPGDSGGPLIIDQAFGVDVRTIIAVLSGGSTFVINGVTQPAGSYGSQNFYQPLFLYWDWVVGNNPYRYVTALAGDRNWEDGSSWVTELDPAYRVLVNNQLVNGLPTNLGGAKAVTTPEFGEICFQSPSSSPNPSTNNCVNLATGQSRNNVPNGSSDSSSPLAVQITDKEEDDAGAGQAAGAGGATNVAIAAKSGIGGETNAPHNHIPGYTDTVRPAPTLANGLPGATNFVPNNVDPVRTTGVSGRYYDVTLRNAGAVTLNSTVTIDNLAIAGIQSQLNIASAGSLTSLVEVNQLTGVVNVNGTLTSRGDYFFMSGLLTGNGRVNAPFLTSVMGNFAPGTLGTFGTLTIGGNLVMSSGSTYFADIGSTFSDQIAVVANGGSTGSANVGGQVVLSRRAGSTVRFGDTYTILTAQGGVTGTFGGGSLSVILRPEFIYSANAVQVKIAAIPFESVINSGSRVQSAYAALLDRNRGNAQLNGIYDVLDFATSAASIQSTLEALAPRTETLRTAVGIAAMDNNSRVIRDRLQALQPGDLGGRLAYYGKRVETAALNLAGMDSAGMATMSDVSVQPQMAQTRLPENMGAFIAAGYLEGQSRPMPTTGPFAGNDQFDGFYIAGGLEGELNDGGVVGVALSYTDLEGSASAGGQSADGQLFQLSSYGKLNRGILILDGQLSLGLLETDTQRPGALPGQSFTLESSSSSFVAAAEVGVGAMFGDRIRFGPRGALRASYIDFGRTTETGGPTALAIDREDIESLQGRAGLVVEGAGRIRPNFTATYVHEFEDRSPFFGANFVGGIGPNAGFDLGQQDDDWFEVAGGLTIATGQIEVSVSADTTIDRDDVENQSYRAAVKFRF